MKPLYMLALHRARYGCTCCKSCFKGSGFERSRADIKAKTKKVYTRVARARLKKEARAEVDER